MIDTDPIQELHDDLFGALSADPGMVYVPVYQSRTPLQRDGDGNPIVGQTAMIEEQIKSALAGMEKYVVRTPGQSDDDWKVACAANGKAGIACVVMLPDVEGESVNSAAPALKLIVKVRVIENRMTNEGPGGTGITASQLSAHVLQVLNRRSFRGRDPLYPDLKRMIAEVPLPDDERCHEVTLVQHVTPETLRKVATPTVAENAGSITLACTTAGAAMYSTLDGSFPGSGNAAAALYDAPFTLGLGVHCLRVAAQHDGMQASNDLVSKITIE